MLPSLMTPTHKASARGVQEINISRGERGGQCALAGELIKWIRAGTHKSRAPDSPSDYTCTVELHVRGSTVLICRPTDAWKFEVTPRVF